MPSRRPTVLAAATATTLLALASLAGAVPGDEKKPDFPPFDQVSEGLDKVVSTADGSEPLYGLFADKKEGRLLAELPRNHENQLLMIATTVASGDEEAGVMGSSVYAKWRRIGKRLALVEPDFIMRSHGDEASKESIQSLYTDRVLLDVPIVSTGPNGGPVIDLRGLMIDNAALFFGSNLGGYGPMVRQTRGHLASLAEAKAFPENVEVAWEVPRGDGRLVVLHYSIRVLESDKDFKPREADNRVGYFNVWYRELGDPGTKEPYRRLISRWNVQKADPSLRMSPPKQPIVWYIEHTTPVRYRRFVREGILAWNEAFEDIGIVGAVEVYQQDEGTGAHMDKDPEDARYNFFRWNTSTQGYAIGPSRWDPRTGQILDADVVWHAGLTDAVMSMYQNLTGEIAVQGMTPETLGWLADHPQWDPRVRLAPPAERERRLAEHRRLALPGDDALTAAALPETDAARALDNHDRALGQSGAACRVGEYLSMDVALVGAAIDGGLLSAADDASSLDGLPEQFLGGMIRYIAAHEVGHTMGLQHNFGASTIRSLEQINSEEMAGQPFIASVMEYAAPNINADDGPVQGQYATPRIGPYDKWAIAFGYGPDDQREAVLARVAEPDHVFLNDIATIGPDPRAQTWDMGADPLNFAESRQRIITDLRGKLVGDLVKDGEPWSRARQRYEALLSNHMLTLVVASRWVGGAYTHWDWKGDPDGRDPLEVVDPAKQRRALEFIIDHAFRDDAFGLSPELVRKLGVQYWPDAPGYQNVDRDPIYELHDIVAGVQAAAMTMLINPTKLRRLYDNEFAFGDEVEDPITLAEVMNTVSSSVWSELDDAKSISSFRRNLQREYLERLIDLSQPAGAASPSSRTIANLSAMHLHDLKERIDDRLKGGGKGLDDYTRAHLLDAQTRIDRALEAVYVVGS